MRTFLVSFFSLFTIGSFAQQIPIYTLFFNGYSLRNPATTGLFYQHNFASTGRIQWVGIDGAPKTANALYDFRWNKIHGGIGVNHEIDKYGLYTHNKTNLNYAYHISFAENHKLSIGSSISFVNIMMDQLWIPPQSPDDNSLPKAGSANMIDLNLGIMYKKDQFSAGFATNQVLESKAIIDVNDSTSYSYQNARHYFVHCDYSFDLNENLQLVPSLLIASVVYSTSVNVNLRAIYKKQFWIGSSYRTSYAVSFMAGVDLKQKYRICYAYDFVFGPFSEYTNGSHEVGIALMLN